MRHPRGLARRHGVSDIQFSEFRPQTRAFPCDSPFELARDRFEGRADGTHAWPAPSHSDAASTAALVSIPPIRIGLLLFPYTTNHPQPTPASSGSKASCRNARARATSLAGRGTLGQVEESGSASDQARGRGKLGPRQMALKGVASARRNKRAKRGKASVRAARKKKKRLSMTGSLAKGFHEGSRSEYLAQFVFSSFGTAIPVPHQAPGPWVS
jgi:hypothetical protein